MGLEKEMENYQAKKRLFSSDNNEMLPTVPPQFELRGCSLCFSKLKGTEIM